MIVLQLKDLRSAIWLMGRQSCTIARSSNHVAIRQGKGLIIFPTEAASITSARATLLLHDNAW